VNRERLTLHVELSVSDPSGSQQQALTEAESVDCAVVIVTYNSAHDIAGLLESLPAAADGLTLRTIVVDNGSTDATVDLATRWLDAKCFNANSNLGYAGGINVGRELAGEYRALLVLNPDVVLEPFSLREMFAGLNDPGVGIVAPMIVDTDGSRYPSLRREPTLARAVGDGLLGSRIGRRPAWLSEIVRDESAYCYRHDVEWATGAALLVSAACDRAVGRWDERFFLYSEETDYAARARSAGFRLQYRPSARVRHHRGGSGRSSALLALMAVNRIRYVEKHGSYSRAYRVAVIVAELLRSTDVGHRLALKTIIRRSGWPDLIKRLSSPD
jgi:GT2 family glycosyltransferase